MTSTPQPAANTAPWKDLGGLRRIGLLIDPLDVLFCRDGRPFGAAMVPKGTLPHPQTFAGVLRTRMLDFWREGGFNFEALHGEAGRAKNEADPVKTALKSLGVPGWIIDAAARGPWLSKLALDGENPADVFVAAPADLVSLGKKKDAKKAQILRLRPRSGVVDWSDSTNLLPLWPRQEFDEALEPIRDFVSHKFLKQYLSGGDPSDAEDLLHGEAEFYAHESRVGIEIDPDRLATREERIYSVRMLRLKEGVRLYAELDVPKDAADQATLDRMFPAGGFTTRMGGEGKVVEIKPCAPITWPDAKPADNRLLVVLTTPMRFECTVDGTPRYDRPPYWCDSLKAAAVPGYTTISGWDLARRRPKPARHYVNAGSVYFYDFSDSPESIPDGLPWDIDAAGYGVALKGTWNHHHD